MRRLLTTEHLVIDEEPERRLVRMLRTDAPLDSPAVMQSLLAAIIKATRPLDKPRLRVLVDLRRAPMRVGKFDPQLRALQQTVREYARSAVVVRTAVGSLQVSRISRETGVGHGVFHTEQAALAFLDSEQGETASIAKRNPT
jgi:hypothetical protein